MKKWFSVLLVFVMLLTCGACGFDIDGGDNTGDSDGVLGGIVDKPAENANQLGDYIVEIKSCRMAKDFSGEDVIIITYSFTNEGNDTPTAFYLALEDNVYQGGIGLNESYILDDSANYKGDNSTKEIKKGNTIDVEVAYELNDMTTDVEVEVSELISFSDKTVTKTFTLE